MQLENIENLEYIYDDYYEEQEQWLDEEEEDFADDSEEWFKEFREDFEEEEKAENLTGEQGEIEEIVEPFKKDWSYDRQKAADYALEHCTDEPEYSKKNNGSDCANFVSKCINAGGIEEEHTKKQKTSWFPGSDNWIRTEYNKNGGVVPYMTSKGYFNKVKKSGADIGDIVYWNNQSHVALVTKREETIKKDKNGKKKKKVFIYFSQHSNETLPETMAKNLLLYDTYKVTLYDCTKK